MSDDTDRLDLENKGSVNVWQIQDTISLTVRGPDDVGYTQALTLQEAQKVSAMLGGPPKSPHNFIGMTDNLGGKPTVFCSKCGIVAPTHGPSPLIKDQRAVIEQGCTFKGLGIIEPVREMKQVCTAKHPMPDGAEHEKWEHPDMDLVEVPPASENYRGTKRCRHCRRLGDLADVETADSASCKAWREYVAKTIPGCARIPPDEYTRAHQRFISDWHAEFVSNPQAWSSWRGHPDTPALTTRPDLTLAEYERLRDEYLAEWVENNG